MDRFIEAKLLLLLIDLKHLKSNMDRFIGVKSCVFDFHSEFKIQYGQIYRIIAEIYVYTLNRFKIQYGQIYRKEKVLEIMALAYLKSNMDRFIECKAVVQHSANVI